ncbi:MAG: hypothetical protein ACOWWH_13505 [Eubacteriaceae bacterium]
MSEVKKNEELFEELKKELVFLPDIEPVRQGFIEGFILMLLN